MPRRKRPGKTCLFAVRTMCKDLIDQAVFNSLLGGHKAVALGIQSNLLNRLVSIISQNLIQALAQFENLTGMDFDIRGLALGTTRRLVNHDTRVGQCVTLALVASSQQESPHASGPPCA